ncbi:MAG: acyltransferase [Eubacteriales bacterium]
MNFNESIAYVSHLWTISLEEQFYLILPFIIPFLIKLKKKHLLYIGIGIWGLLLIIRLCAVLLNMPNTFIWTLPISGDAFLFGILAALGAFDIIFEKIPPSIKMLIGISLLVYSTFFLNVNQLGMGQLPLYTIIAVGFLFIMEGANSNNIVFSKIFGKKPIKYLGKISYGLYVFHVIVISYVPKWCDSWLKSINTVIPGSAYLIFALCFLITLAVVILISIASYKLYEKHFIRLKNKFIVVQSRPEKFKVPKAPVTKIKEVL